MNKARYILALDQGTTSSRAMIFDARQRVIASAQREFKQSYPREGWAEHDPMDIYSSQIAVMAEAIDRGAVRPGEITAIGIANQRETTVIWERATGKPAHNAIVWQCRRTADIIDKLIADGMTDHIRAATGLTPDAYFSGSKIKWILDRVDPKRERASRGDLLFGTVDTWLIWNLTQGRVHATDTTNASRTMIFDIHKFDWDDALLRALDIPRAMLPAVKNSGGDYGFAEILGVNTPIAGIAGDQQAALFGQRCFFKGEAKNTYGTGCFMLMNTGSEAYASRHGLITTIAPGPGGAPVYALEGSVFTGGAVIQWLRDEVKLFHESRDAEYFARKVSHTGGVYLVPAFTGLGAPHWDMRARGAIVGLTRGTTREHIIRAAEESIAYQVNGLIRAMESDTGRAITALNADGGAARDDLLMQFQADISNVSVKRPAFRESTALGAAYLAGLRVGIWDNLNQIRRLESIEQVFEPRMDSITREALINGWNEAIGRVKSF
jgi:glycerol kinase